MAIFGVGVRFKNFFVTFLYRQSTLVLEVQTYLYCLKHPYLGPLQHFFGPSGLFLVSRSGSNTFLEPTNVDYQFLVLKCSPIFLFQFGQIWPFALFRSFGVIFVVVVRFKPFLGTSYVDNQIGFLKYSPIFLDDGRHLYRWCCRLVGRSLKIFKK